MKSHLLVLNTIVVAALFWNGTSAVYAQGSDSKAEADAPAQDEDQEEQQEQRAESIGILEEYLAYGTDGSWTLETDGESYQMNSQAKGDVKYFFLDNTAKHDGRRACEVTVKVTESASGGLIYAYNDEPKSYYLIVISADNTLKVLDRSPEGFSEKARSAFDLEGEDECRLTIRENGERINIFVNGVKLIGLGNARMGKGGIGIAAISGGSCEFSDFNFDLNQID